MNENETPLVWQWSKLEVLFETKFGKASGNRTVEVDGYTITRSVSRQPSNSGKTHTWKINFIIKDTVGNVKMIEDPDKVLNRANDPNRNWGLGPE